MNKLKKIAIYLVFIFGFFYSIIINTPAWVLGSLISHYSQGRVSTSNEQGSFWNGQALLMAHDGSGKIVVPLMMVGWNIKLGFSKFIAVNLTASNKTIANASLNKAGISLNNVNLGLSLDQLTPFLGNLNALNLSGNVRINADNLSIGKQMNGTINIQLQNVGSGISPVNPIGSYSVSLNLNNSAVNVNTSSDSVITVTGDGNLNSLMLNSRVQADKKDKLLQFMTMMGIPQLDGSYQLKVF